MHSEYVVRYNKSVLKFLSKHDDIEIRFFEKLKMMRKNPFDLSLDIKPLQWEEKWAWRLRIWKYRFKYVVIDMEIVIYFFEADNRWDIYK